VDDRRPRQGCDSESLANIATRHIAQTVGAKTQVPPASTNCLDRRRYVALLLAYLHEHCQRLLRAGKPIARFAQAAQNSPMAVKRPREEVMQEALYAMYIDMCEGCTRAGLLPPTPEEWADMLAEHLAQLARESPTPPSGDRAA
jgi:hypothetical protein